MNDGHWAPIRRSALSLHQSILAVTKLWAESRSKDPSSKVGACLYDPSTGGLYLGYNGFPSGVPDFEHIWARVEPDGGAEPLKYDMVVHAESNAVRKALVAGVDMSQAVLIVTHHPCDRCLKDVIATSGIKTVLYESDQYRSFTPRVQEICRYIAHHCGITIKKINEEEAC